LSESVGRRPLAQALTQRHLASVPYGARHQPQARRLASFGSVGREAGLEPVERHESHIAFLPGSPRSRDVKPQGSRFLVMTRAIFWARRDRRPSLRTWPKWP